MASVSVDSGVDSSNDSECMDFGVDNRMKLMFPPPADMLLLRSNPEHQTSNLKMRRKARDCKARALESFPGIIRIPNEKKLRLAAATNNVEQVKALLAAGVNPNCADDLNRSPLHIATSRGYLGVVRELLANGANPDSRDQIGNTALHLAACNNDVSMVTVLLNAGIDASSHDRVGRSPLQLAQSRLRLFQHRRTRSMDPVEMDNLRREVHQVVNMMLLFLKKKKQDVKGVEEIQQRLAAVSTSEEVDTEVSGLLANLEGLTL